MQNFYQFSTSFPFPQPLISVITRSFPCMELLWNSRCGTQGELAVLGMTKSCFSSWLTSPRRMSAQSPPKSYNPTPTFTKAELKRLTTTTFPPPIVLEPLPGRERTRWEPPIPPILSDLQLRTERRDSVEIYRKEVQNQQTQVTESVSQSFQVPQSTPLTPVCKWCKIAPRKRGCPLCNHCDGKYNKFLNEHMERRKSCTQ